MMQRRVFQERIVLKMEALHATTILCVRRAGKVAMAGDGQVTAGSIVMKAGAKKVRRLYHDTVLAGFAGGAADAFTLYELFEEKVEEFNGDLARAAVELARSWRRDKMLRTLEAMMLVADRKGTYLVSGNGDVIEPDCGVIGIGSGGAYAYAAGRALLENTRLSPAEVARKALKLAGQICIYTNDNIIIEELE